MPSLDDVRPQLDRARHGYLATASPDADPHLQPVVFAPTDDAVYIAIDEKPKTTVRLRRLTNIEDNPRFALLVDHYEEDWTKLSWTLLRGPANVLWPEERDEQESAKAIQALRARYPQYEAMALEKRPLLRLIPERITAWSADGNPRSA